MKAYFKGILHCPGCGKDTQVHVTAEAQPAHLAPHKNGTPLYIPIEDAQCEFCPETFPIYYYEDGIELVVEQTGSAN